MANVPGFGTGFSPDAFRTNIKNAMKMGAAIAESDRVTFRWSTVNTFSTADSNGNPWDFTDTPEDTESHDDVLVDCAVEFIPRTTLAGGTSLGHFDTPRVVLTLLDEDYEQVEGADLVLLGQNTYVIDYIAPPFALFSVGVFQIHASARDEA